LLAYIFRKKRLRSGQLPIILRALARRDVIGLLPTGAGKSISFLLPAFLTSGVTLVVEPIKALMDDQVDNLENFHIDKAISIHSGFDREERNEKLELLAKGETRIAYIAPERFQIKEFRQRLVQLAAQIPISFVVIDEAHCVSEWGHDFRTSYLDVGQVARDLSLHKGKPPPVLGLTGTASQIVLEDLIRELALDETLSADSIIVPTTFDRRELRYHIVDCPSEQKARYLVPALQQCAQRMGWEIDELVGKGSSGIVFCRHVNGLYGVFDVKNFVQSTLGERGLQGVDLYSGAKPRELNVPDEEWEPYKRGVHRRFKEGKLSMVVATQAFGMGIDKENVRFTVHYGIPNSLEALYQEAGRAGRDQKAAVCGIIFSEDDPETVDSLLAPVEWLDPTAQQSQGRNSKRKTAGDAERVLFFLEESFRSPSREVEHVETAFHKIQSSGLRSGEELAITWGSVSCDFSDQQTAEKAVYRLKILGIVQDYTVNFAGDALEVVIGTSNPEQVRERLNQYVRRYRGGNYSAHLRVSASRQFESPVHGNIYALIWFVYDEIERKRREAIKNINDAMRDAVRSSNPGETLRKDLLAYLEKSESSEAIQSLVHNVDARELPKWIALVLRVKTVAEARQLIGAVRRTAESFPGHPGLLVIQALATLYMDETRVSDAVRNLASAVTNLLQGYDADPAVVRQYSSEVAMAVHRLAPTAVDKLAIELAGYPNFEVFARGFYRIVGTPEARRLCALPMLRHILDSAEGFQRSHIDGEVNHVRWLEEVGRL
jgi:ATP-dependent DNA helicase RecQ